MRSFNILNEVEGMDTKMFFSFSKERDKSLKVKNVHFYKALKNINELKLKEKIVKYMSY